MSFILRYLFIPLIFIFIHYDVLTQEALNKNDLEVRFFKDKVDIKPGKSFFNILSVKNRSEKLAEFNVKFNAPRDWEIIGEAYESYTLPANQSMNIPVRVSVANDAKGGVGYVIVASVTDPDCSLIAAECSFLNISVE